MDGWMDGMYLLHVGFSEWVPVSMSRGVDWSRL